MKILNTRLLQRNHGRNMKGMKSSSGRFKALASFVVRDTSLDTTFEAWPTNFISEVLSSGISGNTRLNYSLGLFDIIHRRSCSEVGLLRRLARENPKFLEGKRIRL